MQDKVISPEKTEEAKLKARYPNLGARPGGSDFLRKRLQKGVRLHTQPLFDCFVNGQSCTILTSLCVIFAQPKYFDSGDYNMAKAKIKNKQLPSTPTEKTEITGEHIPTPQDLPKRKTSIVASKLAV